MKTILFASLFACALSLTLTAARDQSDTRTPPATLSTNDVSTAPTTAVEKKKKTTIKRDVKKARKENRQDHRAAKKDQRTPDKKGANTQTTPATTDPKTNSVPAEVTI